MTFVSFTSIFRRFLIRLCVALLTETDAKSTGPPVVWQYAKFPDSFKASLQQMVGHQPRVLTRTEQNLGRRRIYRV
jgi:hypothetical protein